MWRAETRVTFPSKVRPIQVWISQNGWTHLRGERQPPASTTRFRNPNRRLPRNSLSVHRPEIPFPSEGLTDDWGHS